MATQVRRLEHVEVLRHALPRHVQVFAQLVERLAVVRVQHVQQLAPARIRQGLEQQVGVGGHSCLNVRQVITCMSSAA